MERQRRWQFILILAVIAITAYNILPTVFYYLKPLKDPIRPAAAAQIAESIEMRLQELETETEDWLRSFCHLIRTRPISIGIDRDNPQFAKISFAKTEDAARFRALVPRAGALIPFAPAQLSLATQQDGSSKEVLISRKIPISFQKEWFSYVSKNHPSILLDRVQQIALSLCSLEGDLILQNYLEKGDVPFAYIEPLAAQINTIASAFSDEGSIESRLASRFIPKTIQGPAARSKAVQTLISSLDHARDLIRKEKSRLAETKEEVLFGMLELKEKNLLDAELYLKKHPSWFANESKVLDPSQIHHAVETLQTISLQGISPLFASLSIDLSKDRILLSYLPDVASFRAHGKNKERLEQLLIDEAARIARVSHEEIIPSEEGFAIPLHHMANLSGYLVLDQTKLAASYTKQVQSTIKSLWHPKHPDLQNLQIVDFESFSSLSPENQALCLLIGSPQPSIEPSLNLQSFKPHAVYVVAKGMGRIMKSYESFPDSDWARVLQSDIRSLMSILYQDGFLGYPGEMFPDPMVQPVDFLFENLHYSQSILAASREDFISRGTRGLTYLELADTEQRILTENKIDTQIHADLLKWQDDYATAQVSLNPQTRFDVPKPTKSPFWNNLKLSARKYFRGDERKILRWGLDLSGGKTIQIELLDSQRQTVSNDDDLKQGINELYSRVNKMGVSEVSIRQLGHQIVLDFPGSQAMSAQDLIQASTLVFNIVNEKYGIYNSLLAESVNRFLQEVWNEATITGRKDPLSIDEIASKHLHPSDERLRSEAAKTLWNSGLRFKSPEAALASRSLDDTLSKVVLLRGSRPADWNGQSHPLLIVFRNWVLEGADLKNIHAGYDPSEGNFLSFEVDNKASKNAFHAWTSRYCQEKIAGTIFEQFTQGRGWRMAVLLNDHVISSPNLKSTLRDSARISGSFSQREVNLLAADLKAGALTFTPHILSEKNVSPELGKSDKIKGVTAAFVSLALIVISMICYYRFAGLIASIAVFFNLLILWATLQNLGAALTLAGIAGIILTVGMAVDANVLVFERIKEEFARTGKIASAINAGYQKAFSAIVDSNVTTIIAALILLNFDAGPIKSFAVNLIIGIASSMFTALFMTKFYFTGWAQNPKNTALKMADWIRATSYPFLKWSKLAFVSSILTILAGFACLSMHRSSIFGMDFTGGYALNLELESGDVKLVEHALSSAGASALDFQVKQLDAPTHCRVLLGTSMELAGKPFHQMPLEIAGIGSHAFEKNPRIGWIVSALQNQNISLSSESLSQLHSHWTAMSGQISDTMRNHAVIGLLISFVCIFIYLAFRFEYKFAAAALIGLIHDALITIGAIGLLYACGMSIQIDLNTIAALMTVIGYSLNDTIIIFDRIREEMLIPQKRTLPEIVNHALNTTLGRTAITSGTTLLVLVALVLLGGASIFTFALVMAIGVFVGTLSSWFIASPLMIFFHKREEAKDLKSVSL